MRPLSSSEIKIHRLSQAKTADMLGVTLEYFRKTYVSKELRDATSLPALKRSEKIIEEAE